MDFRSPTNHSGVLRTPFFVNNHPLRTQTHSEYFDPMCKHWLDDFSRSDPSAHPATNCRTLSVAIKLLFRPSNYQGVISNRKIQLMFRNGREPGRKQCIFATVLKLKVGEWKGAAWKGTSDHKKLDRQGVTTHQPMSFWLKTLISYLIQIYDILRPSPNDFASGMA